VLRMRTLALLSFTVFVLAACGDNLEPAPTAPSLVTVAPSGDGAQIGWRDNSDDEAEFVVMRKQDGVDEDYAVIATVPADTTSFVDAPLTAGSYTYLIAAANEAGENDAPPVHFTMP